MKDPGQASRAEELVNTLKQKCVTVIREKKEINDMLSNPNQPPPQFKVIDVITQVEKFNKDIGADEIKFELKFNAQGIKALGGGWVEYNLQLEEGGPKVEGRFDVNKEKFEFRNKFNDANSKTLIKEIRKRELVL